MTLCLFRNHPPGLVVCFFVELWERFSYYGMRALLVFFLTQHLLFSDEESYLIYGAYTAMAYMLPILGGTIADRYLGARKAVLVGGILLVAGHLGLAIEGPPARVHAAGVERDPAFLSMFYLSLALIVTGVGFLKSNISAIVGSLYARGDYRRDGGFTMFYLGINIGGFVAPLLCGWVAQLWGWRFGFGLAGLGMVAGLAAFIMGQRRLQGHAEPPDPQRLRSTSALGVSFEFGIYCGIGALVVLVWIVIQRHAAVGSVLGALAAAAGIGLLRYAFSHCTPFERRQLSVCAILILFTIGFWTFYEQYGSSMNLFADRMVERSLFGVEIPASSLQALPPLFVLLLAPAFSALWLRLGARGVEPPTPVKFVLALMLLGTGFLALALGTRLGMSDGKVELGWLVFSFFMLVCGELCVAPVALSMVTRLAPRRIVGVMMGIYFLGYSTASFLSALLARLTSNRAGGQAGAGVAEELAGYSAAFLWFGLAALGISLALLVLTPALRSLSRDRPESTGLELQPRSPS